MATIARRTRGKVRLGAQESVEFRVDLHYSTDDPYAVSFELFGNPSAPVTWTMAASLFYDTTVAYSVPQLRECITVTFDMTFNEVFLHLHTRGGETHIVIPADEVLRFIDEAKALMTEEVMALALDAMVQRLEASLTEE